MIATSSAPPVWKLIYLARRNPQLPAQAFAQAWRSHSALGKQCTNVAQRVRAVAQCARVLEEASAPLLSSAYDGVNLMVLADYASGTLIWEDPQTLRIMRPDELRVFADYVRHSALVCREHVLHPPPPAVLAPPPMADPRPEPALADHAPAITLAPQAPPPQTRPRNGQVMLLGFLQRSPNWQGPAQCPASLPPAWGVGALAQAQRIVGNSVHMPGPSGYGFRWVVEWWFANRAQALVAAQALEAIPVDGDYGRGDAVFVLTEVTHSR